MSSTTELPVTAMVAPSDSEAADVADQMWLYVSDAGRSYVVRPDVGKPGGYWWILDRSRTGEAAKFSVATPRSIRLEAFRDSDDSFNVIAPMKSWTLEGVEISPEAVLEIARFVDPEENWRLGTSEHRLLSRLQKNIDRLRMKRGALDAVRSKLAHPSKSARFRRLAEGVAAVEAKLADEGLDRDEIEVFYQLCDAGLHVRNAYEATRIMV